MGTVLGVVVFGVIHLAHPRGAWLIAVLVLLQFAIEVALALTFITPAALTIAAAAGTSAPGVLVDERIEDTLLGAITAMLVLGTMEWVGK